MDEFIAEFVNESREMLEALERELVAWEREPGDQARLDVIFRFFHTVKGNCGFFDLPRLEALAHAAEDALAGVRNGKRTIDARLVDAVLAVVDRIGEMVDAIDSGAEVSQGNDDQLIAALSGKQIEPVAVAAPVTAPSEDPASSGPARQGESLRTVRLPTNLVDRFMSGISDMILVRNELQRQIASLGHHAGIEASFNRLSTILADTQAIMTRVRMQPISNLFSSYQRMVRDLAADLGKQVAIEIESGEVELDREMIELLRDPLLHIVRNAVDHGLETLDERRAAGKPGTGQVRLSARQTGNVIRIAISDDGRGIDLDRLVEKAIARGLLTREQASQLTPAQRAMLVCEPGLTTASEVTKISGRGVGMDVVRDSIERIGGKLRVDTTAGMGCAVILDVPLTLSIVPSLTVQVGEQTFSLPRSYVSEIVTGGDGVEAERIGGVRHITLRDGLHPCLSLDQVLGIAGHKAPLQQVLVMVKMIDGSVFALAVDAIVDSGDLVVRPVAPAITATGLYVGVVQLSDGSPALMLDVAGIGRQSDLLSEGQGRLRLDSEAETRFDQAELLVPVVAFAARDGSRKAVAMEAVERIAEVGQAAVGFAGSAAHVVLDGEIIPLLGLEDTLPEDALLDILVISDDACRLAYATAGDVGAEDLDPATITFQSGHRLGLLGDRPVELLEFGRFGAIDDASLPGSDGPTCRLPQDDPWARDFLRPMVEAAGYAVIEDNRTHVDLEVRFDQDAPAGAARAEQVLLIGDGHTSDSAIAREDLAGLSQALRAMTARSAR